MTLTERYIELKRRISGNREKTAFEFTYGMSAEEVNHITPLSAAAYKILAELDFAIKLNAELHNTYQSEINNALSILEKGADRDGVLTNCICAEAETVLLPMQDAAKEYAVICAAHAHIDMNWMWSWQETVAITLSTFRTMLDMMKAYPTFCYSQSQASVYKIVEEYDPAMMDEIIPYIREGRWEITATAWVEADKNMPDTESLIRHILETRRYLETSWQVDPNALQVDFSPDTFGHSAHIPTINTYGQVKYYYHCRGWDTRQVLYRWQSPSGDEVLSYREPYWYNSGITADIGTGLIALSKYSGNLKTGLIVYGVGNHGGGPTRRDIERVLDMQTWPIFPAVRFGTFHTFFKIAESVRERLPIVKHELNAIFSGCYTTQSRIKRGNRRSEAALTDAQAMGTMAAVLADYQYPSPMLSRAWRNVLFTHFHDILTGSCVTDTREHAMSLYADTLSISETIHSNAMRAISAYIDTTGIKTDMSVENSLSEGAGTGYGLIYHAGVPAAERGAGKTRLYTLFNPTAIKRTETVEITVWDWMYDLERITVMTAQGEDVPFQIIDKKPLHYWSHHYFRLLAEVSLASYGYLTLVITEKNHAGEYITYRLDDERTERVHTDIILENDTIRAVFHAGRGTLISLMDKTTGKEFIPLGEQAGLRLVQTEYQSSSAWMIGRPLTANDVTQTVRVEPLPGALRKGLRVTQKTMSSTVTAVITLDQSAGALKYEYDIQWHEYAKKDEPVPVLTFTLPLNIKPDIFRMDIPGGTIDREPNPADVPALSYSAAVYGSRAVSLITDCKYGYRNTPDAFGVTLINSSDHPDLYPERGEHHIIIWVAVNDADQKALKDLSVCLTHPVTYCSTTQHAGKLPPSGSLLSIDAKTTVVSSMEWDHRACPHIRLCELSGKNDTVRFAGLSPSAGLMYTDIYGNTIREVDRDDDGYAIAMKPYAIVSVSITRF